MKEKKIKCKPCSSTSYGNCEGCFYFLGFIGAVVYNISTATGFWNIVLAILKAFVWPAFLIYEVLKFVGA